MKLSVKYPAGRNRKFRILLSKDRVNLIKFLPGFVLILVLFALPLQVWHNTMFPEQTGKILFAGWCIPVLLLILVIQIIKNDSNVKDVNNLDIGFIIFILFKAIHILFIKPIDLNPFAIIEYTFLIIIYLVVRFLPYVFVRMSIYGIFISAIILSSWGFLQIIGFMPSYHREFKVTGSFFNPAPFAGYLAAVLPVVPCLIIRNGSQEFESLNWLKIDERRPALFILPSVVFILVILVSTQSRAAWMALIVSFLYFMFYGPDRNIQNFIQKSVSLYFPLLELPHTKCFKMFQRFLFIIVLMILTFTGLNKLYHLNED